MRTGLSINYQFNDPYFYNLKRGVKMNDNICPLNERKCVPCEGGMPPMAEDTAKELLVYIPGWELDSGNAIKKEFKFKDFKEAMKFINDVAYIADAEDHHPDIFNSYNKVGITLTTHAIGGLSDNDFIVAAKIENTLK